MTLVVGLTGGIGSGKSTVAASFVGLGAALIDADAVSHALTQRDAAGWRALQDAFGLSYFDADGELNRTALRQTVFSDPAQRVKLEAVLHPLIRDETARQLAASTTAYTILMVPLLLEGGRQPQRYQRVLVVDCLEATQVKRVVARSGIEPEQVRAIIRTQIGRTKRLSMADDVIDNEGDPQRIAATVKRFDRLYRTLART
ncbi:MAG: dephospho-CoA kinase [Casimicrobiaceae bacterium]